MAWRGFLKNLRQKDEEQQRGVDLLADHAEIAKYFKGSPGEFPLVHELARPLHVFAAKGILALLLFHFLDLALFFPFPLAVGFQFFGQPGDGLVNILLLISSFSDACFIRRSVWPWL